MKNIAVIFGGRSVEHDISILTGLHAARSVENMRVVYVYLTRENEMVTGSCLSDIDFYIEKKRGGKKCWFSRGYLRTRRGKIRIDAVLNCCHGGLGEDGGLSAYFDLVGIPLTSCGRVAAASMQSKIRTKEILSAAGFLQARYMAVRREDVSPVLCETVFKVLGTRVIVKPDTLGSSIGISVAESEEELLQAFELSFGMDDLVIVEQCLPDIKEINCSVMRQDGEVIVSECETISSASKFFDFETKYLDSTSGFIKKGREKEAEDEEIIAQIKKLSQEAYLLFGARGVVRADFIVSGGKVYLNEINSVPGFLAYHLWARAGVPYGVLIDILVKECTCNDEKKHEISFSSDILQKNRLLVR